MSTIALDNTVAELATQNFDKGLNPLDVASQLEATDVAARSSNMQELGSSSIAELARNVLTQHHAYLWEELPRLLELHAHVTDHHGAQQPHLNQSLVLFTELQAALMSHMRNEEKVFIPLSELDDPAASGVLPDGLMAEVAAHELEHGRIGDLLSQLRTLHNDFNPPENACRKQRALLARLAELEADTHTHVFKENYLLFPRLREA